MTVPVRTTSGHLLGSVSLYSSLNGDAARAYRRDELDLAKELVVRATELEKSPWALQIRQAVEAVASSMPADPTASNSPPDLRSYLALRRRASWRGLEHSALSREWLAHSRAWLSGDLGDRDVLVDAVEALDREASKARAEILTEPDESVSTFFGIVRRMDPVAAELESPDGEALLVPREDLDRQGLAVIGQSVSLLREVLPNGGIYCLPMTAVTLEEPAHAEQDSPWDATLEPMVIPLSTLADRDSEWLDRELTREPTAVPAFPLATS